MMCDMLALRCAGAAGCVRCDGVAFGSVLWSCSGCACGRTLHTTCEILPIRLAWLIRSGAGVTMRWPCGRPTSLQLMRRMLCCVGGSMKSGCCTREADPVGYPADAGELLALLGGLSMRGTGCCISIGSLPAHLLLRSRIARALPMRCKRDADAVERPEVAQLSHGVPVVSPFMM